LVDIRPFKAIMYTEKAGDPASLITQPYDKIDSALQREYYRKSVYNYCRIILPIENDRYETARQRIQNWLSENILCKEEKAAVFVSKQEFKLSGKSYSRTGVIAALHLYPYGENMVFPHEITYSEPKADRLNMLRAVEKDLEPVFLIYSDPENFAANFFADITKTKPAVEVKDALGVKHSIWKVTAPQKINLLRKAMENKKLVITDGHHRYESAITYRDEKRKKVNWTEDSAFNFHMCYLVPVQDEGLTVLPTYRLLKHCKLTRESWLALNEMFTVTEITSKIKSLEGFLRIHAKEHAFVIYDGKKANGLILKDENAAAKLVNYNCPKEACLLDVVILRDVIFKHIMKVGELRMDENILYAGSISSALEKVDSGQAEVAFFVNSIRPETVWQIAQNNWRLPEKSTDFYPKPVSGLLMMDISPEEKL
jgi:uncharacterized protein (DUF1015 family)